MNSDEFYISHWIWVFLVHMHVEDSHKITCTNSWKNSIFGFMNFVIILYFPHIHQKDWNISTVCHAPWRGSSRDWWCIVHVLVLKKAAKSKKCIFREHLEWHTWTKTVLISFCIKCTAFSKLKIYLCNL